MVRDMHEVVAPGGYKIAIPGQLTARKIESGSSNGSSGSPGDKCNVASKTIKRADQLAIVSGVNAVRNGYIKKHGASPCNRQPGSWLPVRRPVTAIVHNDDACGAISRPPRNSVFQ
jgi:uncharacterized Zn-binding protein involved in type VI secretion